MMQEKQWQIWGSMTYTKLLVYYIHLSVLYGCAWAGIRLYIVYTPGYPMQKGLFCSLVEKIEFCYHFKHLSNDIHTHCQSGFLQWVSLVMIKVVCIGLKKKSFRSRWFFSPCGWKQDKERFINMDVYSTRSGAHGVLPKCLPYLV